MLQAYLIHWQVTDKSLREPSRSRRSRTNVSLVRAREFLVSSSTFRFLSQGIYCSMDGTEISVDFRKIKDKHYVLVLEHILLLGALLPDKTPVPCLPSSKMELSLSEARRVAIPRFHPSIG